MNDLEPETSEPLTARQLWLRILAAIAAIIIGTILGLIILGWLMSFALSLIVNE